MVGSKYVNERIENLGPPNAYYFEITKSDGTQSPGVEPGLDIAEPPVKIQIDYVVDFTNEDRKEEITRYSLQNRVVKIFCATQQKIVTKVTKKENEIDVPDIDEITGKQKKVISYKENEPVEIGSFVVNSLNINWDIFEVLKKNPLALKGIIDVCTAYHLGNLLPSQN